MSNQVYISGEEIHRQLREKGYACKESVLFKVSNEHIRKNDGNFVVPNGITIIANSAFEKCINLVSVTFPDSLRVIKNRAFFNCACLEKVNLKNVYIIESYAFSNCFSLGEVKIADKTKVIDYGAFSNCWNLQNINLLNVEFIGSYAFKGCSSLDEVVLSEKCRFNLSPFPEDCKVFRRDELQSQIDFYDTLKDVLTLSTENNLMGALKLLGKKQKSLRRRLKPAKSNNNVNQICFFANEDENPEKKQNSENKKEIKNKERYSDLQQIENQNVKEDEKNHYNTEQDSDFQNENFRNNLKLVIDGEFINHKNKRYLDR